MFADEASPVFTVGNGHGAKEKEEVVLFNSQVQPEEEADVISPAVESVPSSPIIRDFFEQVKQEGRLDDEYDDHEAVIPSAQEESPGNTAAIPEPLVGDLKLQMAS